MNRREFLQTGLLTGTTGAISLPALWRSASAQQSVRPRQGRATRLQMPDLVRAALSTANSGFPVVKPLLSGIFVPGSTPAQLVRAESWDDFTAQMKALSGDYRLTCFTSIQNMNRTWFYGAFQQASGDYFPLRTFDPVEFQEEFAKRQNSYSLVDFNIAWEAGRLWYAGYWLAVDKLIPQT